MARNNRGEVPTKAVDKTSKGMVNSIFYNTSINKVECGILFVVSYKKGYMVNEDFDKREKDRKILEKK